MVREPPRVATEVAVLAALCRVVVAAIAAPAEVPVCVVGVVVALRIV